MGNSFPFEITKNIYRLAKSFLRHAAQFSHALNNDAVERAGDARNHMNRIQEEIENSAVGRYLHRGECDLIVEEYKKAHPEEFEYNSRKTSELLNCLREFASIELDQNPVIDQICEMMLAHESGAEISIIDIRNALNRIKDSDL